MAADHLSDSSGEGDRRPARESRYVKGKRDSLVYFIQAAPGWPIKVGFTNDMKRRLMILRAGCGLHLKVLGVMDGSIATETSLHRRFKEHRIVGEWFKPTVGLVNFIKDQSRPWEESPPRRSLRRSYYLPPLADLDVFPKAVERKIGKGARSAAEKRRLQDDEIDRMDREGIERWRIAAVTGLSESQIYRRLQKIRDARAVVRSSRE